MSNNQDATQAAAASSDSNNTSLAELNFQDCTALVTGGSSGIGLAIAQELVNRGVKQLVIIGQNADRLASAASRLQSSSSNLTVRTISLDLGARDSPERIQSQMQEWNWNVDILVNNAGFARKYVFAEDFETDSSLATVDLMVRAPVELSLRFLPGMIARRKGGVLNLGSTAGHQPVPYTALYAASKAFMHSFSQAVREENRGNGVRFACVVPGVTATNLTGDGHGERRGPIDRVGVDQPADVAKVAVDVLERNAAAEIVGWNNQLFQNAINLLPDETQARIIAKARGAPGQE
ncbi:uncharacterized protein MYCGRDRAFT_38624 [Zymoseptoria tritici IPO323]|uniref:NAD(P)-binding protein n=1 Tax=Zymoseptoria tritici (strain CBS 115943 / IPO323) TaxID=336722 RepID=F9X615_ZYMTI|nr:uncharacterized protein MYCGRDRAFT_38624 [Zymoseptoria tritici IPO323]EGP89612.1 hypothetical protein MYCGRDRAFT_38624 [Zymoseptoria tritici IPO323]